MMHCEQGEGCMMDDKGRCWCECDECQRQIAHDDAMFEAAYERWRETHE